MNRHHRHWGADTIGRRQRTRYHPGKNSIIDRRRGRHAACWIYRRGKAGEIRSRALHSVQDGHSAELAGNPSAAATQGWKLAREDLATFLLNEAENPEWTGRAPLLNS